jgi:hypothetical protein
MLASLSPKRAIYPVACKQYLSLILVRSICAFLFVAFALTCETDRDGTIDMIFPTCGSVSYSTGLGSDCSINIAYNKQLPLCTSAGSLGTDGKRTCRRPEQLCTADPNFTFDLTERSDNDVSGLLMHLISKYGLTVRGHRRSSEYLYPCSSRALQSHHPYSS